MKSKFVTGLAATGLLMTLVMSAHAASLITNGDFETGTFNGWTTNSQAGSQGSLFVVPNNGGTSPDSGFAYQVNPTGGNFFAITDQGGPGSYSLTQSFTLGSASTVNFSFQFFANNQNNGTFNNGRDYTVVPNQNAEVDILKGGADPFTNSPSDIVAVLYGPGADPFSSNPNPWKTYSNILSLAAGTYQIRFAETDNQFFFQMGVDNVSVTTASAVPLPPALPLFATGLVGLGLLGWRRKKKAAAV
jgi:hypothetical protein